MGTLTLLYKKKQGEFLELYDGVFLEDYFDNYT